MRAAKEVLQNGRKALAGVKESKSDYKDGILPSGWTMPDYHWYVREWMFVKLKGTNGADCDNSDADDQTGIQSINPEEMPGDYYFSGMIAFFLWGHIIENHNQECFRLKKLRRLPLPRSRCPCSPSQTLGTPLSHCK